MEPYGEDFDWTAVPIDGPNTDGSGTELHPAEGSGSAVVTVPTRAAALEALQRLIALSTDSAVTSELLATLLDDARAQGEAIGQARGREIGRELGRQFGRLEGASQGHEQGRLQGRLEGHEQGRLQGRLEGLEEGIQQGQVQIVDSIVRLQHRRRRRKELADQAASEELLEQVLSRWRAAVSDERAGSSRASVRTRLQSAPSSRPEAFGRPLLRLYAVSPPHCPLLRTIFRLWKARLATGGFSVAQTWMASLDGAVSWPDWWARIELLNADRAHVAE